MTGTWVLCGCVFVGGGGLPHHGAGLVSADLPSIEALRHTLNVTIISRVSACTTSNCDLLYYPGLADEPGSRPRPHPSP